MVTLEAKKDPPEEGARHFESLEQQARAVQLGVGVLLASEVLLFGAIMALIAGYRASHPAAFADGVHHADKTIGSINTAILLASSTVVALGIERARVRPSRGAAVLVFGAAGLGAAFMALKIAEYGHHIASGIVPGGVPAAAADAPRGVQIFWALYYLATGLHGAHVAVGVAALIWMGARLIRHERHPRPLHALEAVGLYWHFVDVVWLFLWPLFYLA